MAPSLHSREAEVDELVDVMWCRPAAVDQGVVHARHREVVDELDVAVVAAERVHRRPHEIEQLTATGGDRPVALRSGG